MANLVRDAIVIVLTVAVLGWVGTNLVVIARRGSRAEAVAEDLVVVALVAVAFALAGCGGRTSGFRLVSPDLRDGSPLAERFTCTGDNAVPTIRWTDPPGGTQGWAVVVEDPDAPTGTFTHWVVTGLSPGTRSVGADLPPGAVVGLSSSGKEGYAGPCPPNGEEHRFRYRVHALREPLTLAPTTPVLEARRRIETASIDAAEIEVTYRTP